MKKVAMVLLMLVFALITGCSQNMESKESKTVASTSSQNEQPKSVFPEKPIELVIPYDVAGTTDVTGRIVANAVNKYLPNGQSVVVVNQPGGGGTVGMTEVFRSNPDGYKIAFTSVSPITINPHIQRTIYPPDGFQPIMKAFSLSQVLLVSKDSPWKTFEEWLDYVKKNPGKFTVAVAGSGTTAHLAIESLNDAAGIQTKVVPFKGTGPALTALLGGHVHGAIVGTTDIDPTKLRPLVTFGSTRSEMFKDAPTLKEVGINVSIELTSGILAPKGLPKDVTDILHDAFKKALDDPELKEQFKKAGVQPSYASPTDFQKEILDSFHTSGEIMKKIGLAQ